LQSLAGTRELPGDRPTLMRIAIHLQHKVPSFTVGERQLERLRRELARHELIVCDDRSAFLSALPDVQAALVWVFQADWYALAPRLELVMTPAAGRELVQPDPRGRVPAVHGSFHGRIMSESLLAMIGFVQRRFGVALEAQQRRAWERAGYQRMRRLAGQTVLIIGYGHVGRHCARLLKAVGMRVHALKRNKAVGGDGADRVFGADELLDAVAGADHVVCILPGDTGTDGLLGTAAFAAMKPCAAVYNIGRGNAVDPLALEHALRGGHISAAFLDVFAEEPLPADSPLWVTPDLFITPHVSALSDDYLDLFIDEVIEHLR
jgi:D-2-hydroxyacid dehydrogenase (NADP+)